MLKVAPVSLPITVILVLVSVVADLEISLIDFPVMVNERFLSASFKNTGVVAPLPPPPKAPPSGVMFAKSEFCKTNVNDLSTPFLVFGDMV